MAVKTTVHFYDPDTGGEVLMVEPAACLSHFRIKGMNTANFMLPRSDPKCAEVAKLLFRREVPLVAILRSDGNLPFLGFPVNPQFQDVDTHALFQLADHTVLLNQGITRITSEQKIESAYMIADELRAAQARGEPPMRFDISLVKDGPPVSLALSAQKLDSFLREMEKQTQWEGFFTTNVTPANPYPSPILAYLNWQPRQGDDRRAEDRWEQGRQLSSVKVSFDYTKGVNSHTSVGGTGDLTKRGSSINSVLGSAPGSVINPAPGGQSGFRGARVDFIQQVTDVQVLSARNRQVILAPENAVTKWEASVVESLVDMSRFRVGDTRVFYTRDAVLGQSFEGVARIVGLEVNADSGVHRVIAAEVA